MSVGSSKNYFGFKFPPLRGLGLLSAATVVLLTAGCLGDGDSGNPNCPPQPYEKIITPVSYQNGHAAYFNISDFDFLFTPNLVISSISLEGVATGVHKDKDYDDDFDLDANGTKSSRCDGDRHVHWNCGGAVPISSGSGTPFCTSLLKFSLNGGVAIYDFMSRVQSQHGALRLGMQGGRGSSISNVRLVVDGTLHPLTCKPPPPPPPPPPVAPITTITASVPAASPSNSTSESITFSANQTGVQFKCSLDGAAAVGCTSPALYSGLSNGAHTFKVSATNSAGLSDANPPTLNWVVDTIPPTVTITNSGSLPTITNATAISVQFTASEASTFSCILDAAAAKACSSPFAPTGLAEGVHTISISAVDALGNVSTASAVYQWTVDLTAPISTINLVTPAAAINNSTQMSFQFSANETATFACSVDNGPFQTCASPFAMNNVSEGAHWFDVRAVDTAGNQGVAVSYSWKADFTPPVINVVNSTPAAGASNAHNLAVNFSLSEPSTVTCSLDGVPAAACSTPFTAPITSEGPHSLTISATDLAGNPAVNAVVNWTMDFTSPILSFGTILPSAAPEINSPNVSLEILASEAVTISATVNGAALGVFTSPLQLSGLAEGAYTVVVSGLDNVGNPANSLTYSFIVDLTPPQLTLQADITGLTNLDSNNLTFSASEAAAFACNIDEAGFGVCQSPLALSGLADGVHTVLVHATDPAGNVSADSSVQWTVDTTPPKTTVTMVQNSLNSYTFTLSANETGAAFVCSLDGAAAQACSSPFTMSGIATGNHIFTARAIDPAGNLDSAGASVSFSVVPPTTTLSANQTSNTAITMTFSSNIAGGPFLCSLDGAAPSACASPLALTGLSVGGHTFAVHAQDLSGNADPVGASFAWSVQPAVTTTINSENPASAYTNQTSISLAFSANLANATFVCSLNGAAAAACVSPITYSGLSDGAKTFKVQAVDIWGTTDPTGASFSWTVDTVPPTTTVSMAQNNLSSFTFTFTSNEPGSAFLCSLDGASPAACTSPLTVTGIANGNHTFTAHAVDLAGNLDSAGSSVSFTVTAPTTTLSAHQTSNTAITLTFSSNISGGTFVCSLDGAAASPCTSPLSLSGLSVGGHTFTAHAQDLFGDTDPVGASSTWSVRAPVTTTINNANPAAADTNQTSMTFTFSASQSDATFICSLNGAAAAACVSPITYSGLSDGAKTFKVQAVDIWGTVDSTGASHAWSVDTVPPGLVSVTMSSTSTSITVNWTTTEAATTKMLWGVSPSTANVFPEDNVYVTTHSVHITGLAPNTLYTVRPAGTDLAGNAFLGGIFSVRTGH